MKRLLAWFIKKQNEINARREREKIISNPSYINNSKIIDGRSVGDWRMYYTVNVKKLQSITHEQFCQENPNAAKELELITAIQNYAARQ